MLQITNKIMSNGISPVHELLTEWLNEKKDTNTKPFDNSFSKRLFEQFSSDMTKGDIFRHLKIIPFNIVYFWFSWKKIDKKTARRVIKEWADDKWCEKIKYHGIRL